MYAVIFKAEINVLDGEYSEMASRLRELALTDYGCTEFTACTEGNQEIAISYWPTVESIQAWKNDALHQQAQRLGAGKWYKSYRVQVVQLIKEYSA